MSRAIQFAIFLAAALSILGGFHSYLWLRLVRDTALASPWRQLASVALLLLCLSLPASFLLSRLLAPGPARHCLLVPYCWMGLLLFLVAWLALFDLGKLVLWLATHATGRVWPLADAALHARLARLLAAVAVATSLVLAGLATRIGCAAPAVKSLAVAVPRLPAALSGTTLVLLTDLHLGPTLGRAFVEDVVRRSNALSPDVIAITGDLVDGSVRELREVVAPLGELRARHGVFFVTGNHEYYSGVDEWLVEIERLGIRVLYNTRARIGDAAASFDLAGVNDTTGRQLGAGHGPALEQALAGRDPSQALVLLAHQPRAIRAAAAAGVGLQLSGHTHGGQFWPWAPLVRLQQPYVRGLHRRGDTWIYVSDGTGFWGPPMRLGTRTEITQVTLHAPALPNAPTTPRGLEEPVRLTTR